MVVVCDNMQGKFVVAYIYIHAAVKFGQVDQGSTALIVLSPDPPHHCEETRLVVICISFVEVFVTGSQCESTCL